MPDREYAVRGRHSGDILRRPLDVAQAIAAEHPGYEVVQRVDGGPWEPAEALSGVAS